MWLESVDTLRSDRSAERRAGANPAMATTLVRLIDYQLGRQFLNLQEPGQHWLGRPRACDANSRHRGLKLHVFVGANPTARTILPA
jgi:hypothetical protein